MNADSANTTSPEASLKQDNNKHQYMHKQALSALLEVGIKKALEHSLNGKALLKPLEQKRCMIHVHELSLCLAFHFAAEQVNVLNQEMPDEAYLNEMSDAECFISLSLEALPELKNSNQFTKLIKQGKLDFYGDLGIAQKFSQIFADIEFDIEESMSEYIGDAQAYTVMSQIKNLQSLAEKQLTLFRNILSDAALDEKPIAVRPIMLANFVDEVRALKTDTERLEAKMKRYESSLVSANSRQKGSK
ncbi:SCP2 domain-containing protein [Ningiella sp. W23]|uniref:ubiquinone biosynthesis accessory factor UbiJ n=1 Tax=Ningiella sp. W23 TaxID=3023715 RepID=UPI0037568231